MSEDRDIKEDHEWAFKSKIKDCIRDHRDYLSATEMMQIFARAISKKLSKEEGEEQ